MKLSLALAAMVALLAATPAAKAETTTLRLNSQFTATAEGSKIDQWFADEVGKATNGEVKIQIFWAGALGAPKENLVLLGSGAIDMAAMSPAYFPSDLPFFTAPNSLPMMFDTLRQSSEVMPRLMKEVPAFGEEAAAHGIRPLFFHLLNPYILTSCKPIAKLEDLKGLKVRTWGEDLPRLFQAAGAIPVNIMIPEIYESLQNGVVDANPFNVDMAVTYKTYEVAKYAADVVIWMGPAWGVWINEEAWQKLSDDNRAKIVAVVERTRARELEMTAAAATEARAALIKAGVVFQPFPKADVTRWLAASPDFEADWIARMAAKGKGEDAKKAIAIMRQVRETVR